MQELDFRNNQITNESNDMNLIHKTDMQYQDYIRRKILGTCCKTQNIPEQCLKEIKPIYQLILQVQNDGCAKTITTIGLFKLLKEYDFNLQLSGLGMMIGKANKLTNQKSQNSLDINAFHQLSHNISIQKQYRQLNKQSHNNPPSIQQLLFRLYQEIQRQNLMKSFPDKPMKEQFGIIMKFMSIGQESQKHMLPTIKTPVPTFNDFKQLGSSIVIDEQDQSDNETLGQLVRDAQKKGKFQALELIKSDNHFYNNKNSIIIEPQKKLKFMSISSSQPILQTQIQIEDETIPKHLKQFHNRMKSRMQMADKDIKILKVYSNFNINQSKIHQLIQQSSLNQNSNKIRLPAIKFKDPEF